jgi:hypothetical protein
MNRPERSQLERLLLVDPVPSHQDDLRPLDDARRWKAPSRSRHSAKPQHDLDRVLPLLRLAIGPVCDGPDLRGVDLRREHLVAKACDRRDSG